MNKADFIKGFVGAVKDLRNGGEGTHYWTMFIQDDDEGKENLWAITVGHTKGEEDNYVIAAKVAYQPSNSIMQCDYDVDWTMPYDKESGEVDDCDYIIADTDNDEALRKIATDLWNKALSYYKA